jgi:hypothetical protein
MRAHKIMACCSRVTSASSHASPEQRARHSRRLRATLAAAPVLFVRAFGPCRLKKTYYISDAFAYAWQWKIQLAIIPFQDCALKHVEVFVFPYCYVLQA